MTIHRPDARPFGGFGLLLDQDGVQPDVFEFQQGAKTLILLLFFGRLSVGRRETATGFGTARFGAGHAGLRTRVIGFARSQRSLEGWAERRAFARSVIRDYRFDEGYDAPRGGLACKLGASSGGGLIA
ncbi:hypothetical protein [Brevundimonas vesicularis]|uniref:hypothetical protein n=1 Tax=Brevundimonas vesicularis TaxID=41276 RepID=UPI000DD4F99F|nr:hypothetical protein [Brevundimonas vesicularis]